MQNNYQKTEHSGFNTYSSEQTDLASWSSIRQILKLLIMNEIF